MAMKNIIFDFDGTLADTAPLIVATMQKSIEDMGLPFRNDDQIKATIGLRLEEIPSNLGYEIENIGETFGSIYRKNFEELKYEIQVRLFEGVKETLTILKEKGYKMAIATSRSQRSVLELTESLGIQEYFDYLLGGDNVLEGKPNPESIFKILKDRNWKIEDTIMIGDMAVDILMGRKAGTKTCGVTYGNGKAAQLKEAGASFIIDSIKALTVILEEEVKEER